MKRRTETLVKLFLIRLRITWRWSEAKSVTSLCSTIINPNWLDYLMEEKLRNQGAEERRGFASSLGPVVWIIGLQIDRAKTWVVSDKLGSRKELGPRRRERKECLKNWKIVKYHTWSFRILRITIQIWVSKSHGSLRSGWKLFSNDYWWEAP